MTAMNMHIQTFVVVHMLSFLLGKILKNGITGSLGKHVFEHGQFNNTSLWVLERPHCVYLAYQIKVHMDHTGTRNTHTHR